MKAAVVREPKQTPTYADFLEPIPRDGERLLTVSAAALSQLTRGRASGTHYSSGGAFPFVAGVDGVGTDADGRRFYFLLPRPPFGAMAERTVVAAEHCIELPADLDDVSAAVIANPGMSSWAALVERARLQPSETVLVNGATGAAGGLAVRIARYLGAGKVIATGRNEAALASTGADDMIVLEKESAALEQAFLCRFANRVDVVLDYIWGASARSLLVAAAKAGPEGVPLRFVQIGAVSAPAINLPATVLRSSSLVMMGSGLGSVSLDRLIASIAGVLGNARGAGFTVTHRVSPMRDVEAVWDERGGPRLVLTA